MACYTHGDYILVGVELVLHCLILKLSNLKHPVHKQAILVTVIDENKFAQVTFSVLWEGYNRIYNFINFYF